MDTAVKELATWDDQVVDESFIRRAVEQAESNALRVALYQATKDAEVLELRMVDLVLRRGAMVKQVIADEDVPKLHDLAVEFLLENADLFEETVPSAAETKSLMELLLGHEITDSQYRSQHALVGFKDFPYFSAEWSAGKADQLPEDFKVIVIGAGFSGVAMGTQLNLLGIPFEVYEKRPDVGGTWASNRYPDVRVDTMSTTYQLGFVKKYQWKEHFAPATQVRQYIEDTARDYGVYNHINFEHEVTSLTWNEARSLWEVIIQHGGETTHTTANIVVAGTGLFANPKKLDIPGIDDYRGDVLHTAQWPEDYSLAGKKVAVIGNGSTGVQLLKKVASEASEVAVFVRTPQWITPREYYGEKVGTELQWLVQKMPYYANWDRYAWSAQQGALGALNRPDPEWKAKGGHFSEANDKLRAALTEYIKEETGQDEALYSKLIPNYPPWARRMIVDNQWYKTLTEDHVTLVAEGIDHLESDALVTKDGRRIEADVIISASGFSVTKYMHPIEVRGKDGRTLAEQWDADPKGPRAYMSMAVPNFPNLFIFYGPNSQGGAIFPANMELWSTYVAGLTTQMIESGKMQMEVNEQVFEDHYEELDGRTSRMIWMDPDSSDKNYYVSNGRVQVMAAWGPEEHWDHMTEPQLHGAYDLK
ncbi:NAD(P)/FAD-dependent oxidoreductase [Microbacterium sp.]|uniref:flavin-containing monooxygenase n=1 Tax=Microbacterium sp. TaxID=51671 RepID=UPI002732C7D4|nr:NAD(P)/FAD-dependent oxidoreductase [Microbacterium sp.]MDP3950645.1 NAD(P)/FAD-dependent oxidoreductase [Microbacterium sp.]